MPMLQIRKLQCEGAGHLLQGSISHVQSIPVHSSAIRSISLYVGECTLYSQPSIPAPYWILNSLVFRQLLELVAYGEERAVGMWTRRAASSNQSVPLGPFLHPPRDTPLRVPYSHLQDGPCAEPHETQLPAQPASSTVLCPTESPFEAGLRPFNGPSTSPKVFSLGLNPTEKRKICPAVYAPLMRQVVGEMTIESLRGPTTKGCPGTFGGR